MEHIAAIMLLVGCSKGGLSCGELAAPQVAYETMEDCVGALPLAIGSAGDGARIVHGRCAAIDPAWTEEDVEISWRMTKESGLVVDVRLVAPPSGDVIVATAQLVRGEARLP